MCTCTVLHQRAWRGLAVRSEAWAAVDWLQCRTAKGEKLITSARIPQRTGVILHAAPTRWRLGEAFSQSEP